MNAQRGTIVPAKYRWPASACDAPGLWPNGVYPMDVHDSTIPASAIERFWPKVDRSGGPEACWPWVGTKNSAGYGRFCVSARRHPRRPPRVMAHRVAYRLCVGEIPAGLFVCHACDNPPCCNPAHLWLGTNADNTADRDEKGRTASGEANGARRHPETRARGDANGARLYPERLARGDKNPSRLYPEARPRGSAHANAKLSEPDVIAIRSDYRAGGISRASLARRYGVDWTTINKIICRQSWAHVAETAEEAAAAIAELRRGRGGRR